MAEPEKVRLGDHELDVYAQRHAYLAKKLGKLFATFAQSGEELSADMLSYGQGAVYELLSIFIPQLPKRMPEYEFRGYASKEALDADEYDPEQDKSPTVPEVTSALEAVTRVNRFDLLKHLGRWVDSDLLRARLNQELAMQALMTSPNLPSTNGESQQTSSGTKDRTSKKKMA